MSQGNLNFELLNILYNLAALYSQLAASANCATADDLKSAYNNFCSAARVISYLKTTVILKLRSTPAEDIDLTTLESLKQLLLAQA
jgi:programmed cell death 6-interacting protein